MTREAELELEIARLREALEAVKPHVQCDPYAVILRALSTPPSTTALQSLIEKVERRTIERCAVACDLIHGGWHGDDSDVWLCMREIRNLPIGNLKLEDLK